VSRSARHQVLNSKADANDSDPGDGIDDEVVRGAHDDQQGGHRVKHS
jgi:hypothetical protein